MLNSSYNLNRLGSPTAGDLINTSVFDACGGSGNYFKPSPPFNMYDPNLQSYACNPPLNSLVHQAAHHQSSTHLPRRRYSIGGLPTATTNEYLNLQHQTLAAAAAAAGDAHLSNLLNEAKTSITRSSQILSRGEDLSGDIMLSAAAGDVIADLSHRHHLLNGDLDITGANILNQLPITYSSQPNIYYSQPNYTNSHMSTDLYLSRFKRAMAPTAYGSGGLMGIGGGGLGVGGGIAGIGSGCNAASTLNWGAQKSQTLTNPILTAYTNPYFNSTHQTNVMNYNSATSHSLPYSSYNPPPSTSLPQQQFYHHPSQSISTMYPKYNQPPPPYSSVLSQTQQQQQQQQQYHRPLHYTSNPVISQSSNYYFKHPTSHQYHSKIFTQQPTNAASIAQTSTSASYLHHQNQHPYSGYSNQHFDHLNNSNCYSKLDLVDYTKQSEQTKRQVSFNIDVDTLSITS